MNSTLGVIALADSRFAVVDTKAFGTTAAVVMRHLDQMKCNAAEHPSFDRMNAIATGQPLSGEQQHAAVCAFLDYVKFASEQEDLQPETFSFAAKCREYSRYLDEKVAEFGSNPRANWSTESVKSDNNATLAKVVDEIILHLAVFGNAENAYQSLVAYTEARLRSLMPSEILGMKQEANINLILPYLEKAAEVPGDVAEFGCFRGILSVKLAWYLKAVGANKHYFTFDTFHGFEIEDPGGGALGIGAFRDDVFNAYEFLTKWSRVLPLTAVRGDATQTCSQLTKPLSFVWLDLDMDVLMDPVLRKIWSLCSTDTIIGVDDVGRPETPTVAPWLNRLISIGALEPIFNSDDIAPNTFIRFLKKGPGAIDL